jgi:hypothetical protein
MTHTIRTDYAAYNARGVQVRTFNDLPRARAWVRDNASLHVGLHLQEVSLVARKIYTPRSRPAADCGQAVFA